MLFCNKLSNDQIPAESLSSAYTSYIEQLIMKYVTSVRYTVKSKKS